MNRRPSIGGSLAHSGDPYLIICGIQTSKEQHYGHRARSLCQQKGPATQAKRKKRIQWAAFCSGENIGWGMRDLVSSLGSVT